MQENVTILNNLQENQYLAPKNYFNSFCNRLYIKISSQLPTYTLPSNYFTNLPQAILNKAKQQQTANEDNLSPLLLSLQHKNPYLVANTYFKDTSIVSKSKTNNKQLYFKPFYYISAAVLLGLLGVGLFWVTNKNVNNSQLNMANVPAEVSKLNDTELLAALDVLKNNLLETNYNTAINSPNLSSVTDEELEKFELENQLATTENNPITL
jgi:hypothetical protein